MSKDETGNTESQGIPGYSANNSIPGGFALPIPSAGAGASEPEHAPADPWSSTWDDTSWQSGVSDETAAYDPSELNGINGHAPVAADAGSDTSTNTWTDWEPSDPGTADWSATDGDAPAQSYTGWTPAGSTPDEHPSGSDSGTPSSVTTDHSAAQQAYAARPALDPDVAAAAAEAGYEPETYDLTP